MLFRSPLVLWGQEVVIDNGCSHNHRDEPMPKTAEPGADDDGEGSDDEGGRHQDWCAKDRNQSGKASYTQSDGVGLRAREKAGAQRKETAFRSHAMVCRNGISVITCLAAQFQASGNWPIINLMTQD